MSWHGFLYLSVRGRLMGSFVFFVLHSSLVRGRLLAAAGTAEYVREGKEARIYFQKEDSMTATQTMRRSHPRDDGGGGGNGSASEVGSSGGSSGGSGGGRGRVSMAWMFPVNCAGWWLAVVSTFHRRQLGSTVVRTLSRMLCRHRRRRRPEGGTGREWRIRFTPKVGQVRGCLIILSQHRTDRRAGCNQQGGGGRVLAGRGRPR